jgi:ElaA protein
MAALVWQFKSFEALTHIELYAMLQLRTEVFVVEQNCVFQDMDGADDKASLRGAGAGHGLMQQAIDSMKLQWGVQPIRIGAQAHLAKFYAQHGFTAASAPYIEDGIPHIEMLRP